MSRVHHVHDAPQGAVYCGRGAAPPGVIGQFVAGSGAFGNPHPIGLCFTCSLAADRSVHHSRDTAVAAFAVDFKRAIEEAGAYRAAVEGLRGKPLTCWCRVGQRCHVRDVMIPYLDAGEVPP